MAGHEDGFQKAQGDGFLGSAQFAAGYVLRMPSILELRRLGES